MRLIVRCTALAAAVILAVSCLGDPTGPSTRVGGMALQPRFANAMAAAIVDISAVRVVLRRPGDSRIVVDTVVSFPVGSDTLVLGIEVPLVASREQMELTLAMTNAAGDTVFRAGPITVTASTDPSSQEPSAPLFTYVGTGADASGVRFVNPPAAVLFGQSVTLAAEAFDAQQATIVGTPVGFELLNPADSVFATFTPVGSATLVAGTERATVQVRAALPGGQSATHAIAIQPAATSIQLVSGDAQTGQVGMPLDSALVALVQSDDQLPVQGAVVEYVVLEGGQTPVLTVRDTSDQVGLVGLALTLPGVAGPYVVRASLVDDPQQSVAFSLTATAASGIRLEFSEQPTTTASQAPITPGVRVAVVDAAGNVDVAATDPVTLAIGENPGGFGVLSGTLTATPVDGVAAFDDLSIQLARAGYTLVATAGALAPDTSFNFEIVPGAPVRLGFFVQPPLAVTMDTPFNVTVGAVDAFGNPTPTWTGDVTVSLAANPGAGALSGPLTVTGVNGVATFTGLAVDSVGSGYSLLATATGLTSETSNPFDVNVPPFVNAWINAAGGDWSNAANWSRGTVPTTSDTVWVKEPGAYVVNVDVPVTVTRMEMGGTGAQTLTVPAGGSLTVADSAFFGAGATVSLAGGSINGPGHVEVAGALSWTGGGFGDGGSLLVRPGAALTIGAGATKTLEAYTLELAGTGTWTGADVMDGGGGAVLRVLPTGALDIQGDPTWTNSLGGAPSRFEVQGTLTRTTSTGAATLADLTVSGSATVSTGTLATQNAFPANGTYNVDAGAMLVFMGPTTQLGAASTVQGAGTVTITTGADVLTAGAWGVGATNVQGTFSYDGAVGSTGSLILNGTRRGTGLLVVNTSMLWSDGSLLGTGTTRVAPSGALGMTGATAPRTLRQHTLDLQGATVWSDDQVLNADVGARIINLGTFDWTGAGSLMSNTGLPLATFENRGSFSRAGVGVVQMGAIMVDTLGSSWRLDAGDLQLLNGARMGGNPYTGGILELVNGTLSMANGTSWSADGGLVRATGGTVTVDSGATATFAFFELMGGELVHEGTVDIGVNMQWTAGAIRSNTVGEGGRTQILANAAMVIDGAADKTLDGSHVLAVVYDGFTQTGGHIVFDGTGNLHAGGGARLINGGRVWMQGSGAMLSDLAPPTAVFENTINGTLEATTGTLTGTRTMNFALDNLGSIAVNTADTLRFTGGSVNNLSGFASVEVGAIALDAGIYTLTGPWNVQAPLAITGSAQLDLGAQTATVGSDLTLLGGGLIRSTNVPALLQVSGNATFGGGPSVLSAGRLEIGGSFTQSGVATSFQATGTHVTSFPGSLVQAITFATPAAGASRFQNLEIANVAATDSVFLGSDVYVTDSLVVVDGRLGRAEFHRLIVGGNVNFENADGSNLLRPFVLEAGGQFTNDVGGISPDTLVLNRAGPYTWDGITVPNGPHLRFNTGVVTFQATSAPGDLIASGDSRIVIPPTGNRAVLGGLSTRDGGTLQMNVGSDLSVNGSATFAGGGTVGLLDGGRLSVAGDFVQSALNNAASFAPSVSHVTVINGASGSTVSFDTPGASSFDSLVVAKAQFPRSTVTLLTDVRVAGGMVALDGSDIVGPTARLQVTGGTLKTRISTASPTITNLLALELAATPDSIQALVSPDTVVLNAGISALPNFPALQYQSIRLNAPGAITFGNDTIAGDLDIATGVAAFVGTTNFRVNGKLRTRGTGVLMMISTDANLYVADSAIFGGGSTNSALTQGVLTLAGNFVQGGGDPAAFSATGTHRTSLVGTGAQSVAFASPGVGTVASHFADVQIGNASAPGIQLESPVFAERRLLSTFARPAISRVWSPSGAMLSVEGMQADSITFDGVPLSIGASAPFVTLRVISFQNMNPAANQLTITRAGGAYNFLNELSFGTMPNAGAYLVVVNNTAATMTMNVGNPQQTWGQMVGPPPLYLLTGATAQPTVNWSGQTLPPSP